MNYIGSKLLKWIFSPFFPLIVLPFDQVYPVLNPVVLGHNQRGSRNAVSQMSCSDSGYSSSDPAEPAPDLEGAEHCLCTLQNFSFLIHKMRIMPGVVLHACNLSTWGAEAREPSIPG